MIYEVEECVISNARLVCRDGNDHGPIVFLFLVAAIWGLY